MKKTRVFLMTISICMAMAFCTGCSLMDHSKLDPNTEESEEEAVDVTTEELLGSEDDEIAEAGEKRDGDTEKYAKGKGIKDSFRNEDGIGESELLVLSYGTSYNDSRLASIAAIEDRLDEKIDDTYEVRRAFACETIVDKINAKSEEKIDTIEAAVKRAKANGVKNLVVQPVYLFAGEEHDAAIEEIASYVDDFDTIAVGEPLLSSATDYEDVVNAIRNETKEYDDGKTAICLMGHGNTKETNKVNQKLQEAFYAKGLKHYFVGMTDDTTSLKNVLYRVRMGDYKRVVFEPLTMTAGDYSYYKMASDEKVSWKSKFENSGYEVVCINKGLGELAGVQKLFVKHARAAIEALEEKYEQ
ncbi:MAG: sirohydrochlorin cobaltochelatase [Wujia sp.]